MRKIERALRLAYFEGACEVLKSLGVTPHAERGPLKGTMKNYQAFDGPSATFRIDSDVGGARVIVYDDWTHIMFDDPKRAHGPTGGLLRGGCNPYSGKWNHHVFIDQLPACDLQRYVIDNHVDLLLTNLERIGARPEVLQVEEAA